MPRGAKYLLLAILLISIASFAPTSADAGNGIIVLMDQAYYANLDDDGMEDDIVVVYEIILPNSDNLTDYVIELYCTLTLPSGVSYVYECAIVTSEGCVVTQYWFNAATESGWYKYSVYAYSYSSELDSGFDEIDFDPPEGAPGLPPEIDTWIVELPDAIY
ncbi:MAG: hypothetical protein ACFFED_15465 [Candidatus Thorarchaeota archaeon]